jgi:FkbM family methyltransferase
MSRPLAQLRERTAALGNGPTVSLAAADVDMIESDVGGLFVHAADQVMTPALRASGNWEPAESIWLRRTIRPGDLVVDCGANIGYFTLLASATTGAAGAVLAVEPEPHNVALLRLNLWRNGCDNVAVAAVAASTRRDVLPLRLNPTNLGDHQLHDEAVADDVLVPTVALDELLIGLRVNVAKIDTQGLDHDVIEGLEQTIRRNPGLRLLVEFWLEGMELRRVDPVSVLAGYRALERPLGVLADDGAVTEAGNEEILAAATSWEGRYVNIVIGAAGRTRR